MSFRDATDHYLSSLVDLSPPTPERQLLWVRTIDRAQRGFNHAVSVCSAAAQLLLDICREELASDESPRLLARCVLPQTPTQTHTSAECALLLATCVDALTEGVVRNQAAMIQGALQPLRLRSECMSKLATALHARASECVDVQRCLALMTRRMRRINAATACLVQANQRLVAALARQYRNSPLAFLDLVQEGNLGLLRAIERFDPEHGTRVSTYALWWVRRAMVYAIARQGRDVRPSVAQYWAARQVMRATDYLERTQGRHVAHHETARHLGITVAAVQEGLATLTPPVQLDAPIEGADDLSRIDRLITTTTPEPEHALFDRDLRRVVNELLDRLPKRQANILRLRFGIGVRDECTLEQIARQQGVTRERIRQIEVQALEALREFGTAGVLLDTV
jgi:RNA polymerase sigma factor (sigma-70 family)